MAIAIRRRLAALAPARLTGERPGILSVFVEDTDRLEWRGLRERLELEGEARQFMTNPEARPVVAVSFVSRLELFGVAEPDAAPGGELRFRNPGHPAAGLRGAGSGGDVVSLIDPAPRRPSGPSIFMIRPRHRHFSFRHAGLGTCEFAR